METKLLHLAYFAVINLLIVLAGYFFLKRRLLLPGWLLLILSIVAVHLVFLHDGPVIRMLALIATTFTAMKVIAVIEGYKNKPVTLNFKQWFVFATGWAGMRAQPFETFGEKPLPNAWPLIWFGISRVIAGLLLILLAHFIVSLAINPQLAYIIVSAMALTGLSLILHFGLLASAQVCGGLAGLILICCSNNLQKH